jgi:hypothetical protein
MATAVLEDRRKYEGLGIAEPRLFTPPLRELTPETSLGYECIAFGTIVLGIKLDPWQAWFLIHALELLEDGSFRFRTVLLLVARQNGKTTVMQLLVMWAMFSGRVKLVVGTAQDLDVARESWTAVKERIEDDPELLACVPRRSGIVTANGKEQIKLDFLNEEDERISCRYKVKSTTEDSARGIPGVGILLLDELRTHRDHRAYAALSNTAMAVPNALIISMSNAGTAESIVLNEARELGLSGEDPDHGFFEWSSGSQLPDGSVDPDCQYGWAQANPSVGHGRLTWRALRSARAKSRKSLAAAAVFIVENLCRWVETMEFGLDPAAWRGSVSSALVSDYRDAWWYGGLDVALDGGHVTLSIVTPEGTAYRAWVAKTWNSVDAAMDELPHTLKALKLRRLGWCPSGPGAALGGVLKAAGRRPNSRRGTELVEYRGDAMSRAAMGLAGVVSARRVWHQDDAILNEQVAGCARLWQGDRYVFTRRGAGHVDVVYALAFAIDATMTEPRRRRPGGSNEGEAGKGPVEGR